MNLSYNQLDIGISQYEQLRLITVHEIYKAKTIEITVQQTYTYSQYINSFQLIVLVSPRHKLHLEILG